MTWAGFKDTFLNWRNAFESRVALVIPARIHPNHLTAFRLGVILLLPVGAYYNISTTAIFWLVILAGVSDALDGITARQRHQITPLGTFLDPIADKLFALVCFLILWQRSLVSAELVLWMVGLEAHLLVIPILSFAYRLLASKPVERPEDRPYIIRPNFFGKAKMIILISGVALMFLGEAYAWPPVIYVGRIVLYAGLVVSAMALILYILDWVHNKY